LDQRAPIELDAFEEMLVPVLGCLGIFLLRPECMSDGTPNLVATHMRMLPVKISGTPVKGLFAGTLITGARQSSPARIVRST
jgi:Na+/phosphate symporter